MLTALLTVIGLVVLFISGVLCGLYTLARDQAKGEQTEQTGFLALCFVIAWLLGSVSMWYAGYFAN